MAAVSLSRISAAALSMPGQIGCDSRPFFFKHLLASSSASPAFRHTFEQKALASSTASVVTNPDSISDEKKVSSKKKILACPICHDQLVWNGEPVLSMGSATGSSQCSSCKKAYFDNKTHIDLTLGSGSNEYSEDMPASIELFRSPLVSFLYERGWRQSFSVVYGFPGPEKEFELIKDLLKPVLGGNIVDASCGSGLFSRLFAKSGLFSLVVALDFSENMLEQCFDFIEHEDNFTKENLILVRADITRLPFASRSVDAVHAGAALHCWPSPSAAVAEISRVLRPGGVFVATTFILDGPFAAIPFLGPMRPNFGRISGSRIFLAECELKDLCNACGLVDFTCTRNRRFVMISARKPT